MNENNSQVVRKRKSFLVDSTKVDVADVQSMMKTIDEVESNKNNVINSIPDLFSDNPVQTEQNEIDIVPLIFNQEEQSEEGKEEANLEVKSNSNDDISKDEILDDEFINRAFHDDDDEIENHDESEIKILTENKAIKKIEYEEDPDEMKYPSYGSSESISLNSVSHEEIDNDFFKADTSIKALNSSNPDVIAVMSNKTKQLSPYETLGIPEGMGSNSMEWMFECEVRSLTMATAVNRQSMLSRIESRRGFDFAQKLKTSINERLELMRRLNISHPKIDVKKAMVYLENNANAEQTESYTNNNNEKNGKKGHRF